MDLNEVQEEEAALGRKLQALAPLLDAGRLVRS
jgi:hypothetical protein